MRDEDDRAADLLLQFQKIVVQLEARDFVERGKGLVHQDQLRFRDHRACDRDAHFHAARQFTRIGVQELFQPDQPQRLKDLVLDGVVTLSPKAERQEHVVGDGRPGHQRRLLKDDPQIAGLLLLRPADIARGRVRKTRQQPKCCRLPAPRRPEKRNEIPCIHLQVHVLQSNDIPAESLFHVVHHQKGRPRV